MTYYPDLTQNTLAARGKGVRSVGWLSSLHDYPRGTSPPGFLAALRILREQSVEMFEVLTWWPAFAGPHTCEFCGTFLDSGEIAVPRGDLLFVAPRMVVHYVETHDYLPPLVFVQAVMSCPNPATSQYAESVAIATRPDEDGAPRVRQAWD